MQWIHRKMYHIDKCLEFDYGGQAQMVSGIGIVLHSRLESEYVG